MRKLVVTAVFAALVASFLAAPSWAGQRVALVIGNAAYEHAGRLANPLNDARDISGALDRLGFEVTRLDNAGHDGMRRGLREFTRAASASEIAVVFYAGHGIEVDGRNFLIPVDARLASDQDVEYEAIPLDLVSGAVERASELRLVVLDACRNNPFAAAMQRGGATRSIGRGLARVEPAGETLVAYAAKGGSVASDGTGRNSPYTTALLAHLEEPGLEVGLMFRKVRDAVLAATGGRQEPFVYGSLSSKGFYLSESGDPASLGGLGSVAKSDEQLFWESIQGSRDPDDLRAYLEQFPEGAFASLAHNRIKRLSGPLVQKETDPEFAEAMLGLKRTERERIQFALWAGGFDPGNRDGLSFDQGTREAIGDWQISLDLPSSGYLDVETAKTLMDLVPDLSGGMWSVAVNGLCKVWNPSPQPGETVRWIGGDCVDGKASGNGTAFWSWENRDRIHRESYIGDFLEGKRHGRGVAKFADGSRFEGEWRHDLQHGRGVQITATGTRYEGIWDDGKMPDHGVMVRPDGVRYEGEWRDGKPHGHGTMSESDGTRYEGAWRDGHPHGRGVAIHADGRRYEGDLQDGRPHGRGTQTWPDGDLYEGEWRAGEKHGHGTYSWASGAVFEGEWRDGKRRGHGTYTWPSGDRYEGEWNGVNAHGHGMYTSAGGGRHEGEARDGCFEGRDGVIRVIGTSEASCDLE